MRALIIWLLLLSSPAYATVVTITLSVDESFELYLTDDPHNRTGLFGVGHGDETVYTYSAPVSRQTRYLLVVAHDTDSDSLNGGVLAQAKLSDPAFQFGNRHQITLTGGKDWHTFVGELRAIARNDESNPMGVRQGIPENAYWIWPDASQGVQPHNAIMWARINPTPIPEPSALLFAVGALGIMLRYRRARNAA